MYLRYFFYTVIHTRLWMTFTCCQLVAGHTGSSLWSSFSIQLLPSGCDFEMFCRKCRKTLLVSRFWCRSGSVVELKMADVKFLLKRYLTRIPIHHNSPAQWKLRWKILPPNWAIPFCCPAICREFEFLVFAASCMARWRIDHNPDSGNNKTLKSELE